MVQIFVLLLEGPVPLLVVNEAILESLQDALVLFLKGVELLEIELFLRLGVT